MAKQPKSNREKPPIRPHVDVSVEEVHVHMPTPIRSRVRAKPSPVKPPPRPAAQQAAAQAAPATDYAASSGWTSFGPAKFIHSQQQPTGGPPPTVVPAGTATETVSPSSTVQQPPLPPSPPPATTGQITERKGYITRVRESVSSHRGYTGLGVGLLAGALGGLGLGYLIWHDNNSVDTAAYAIDRKGLSKIVAAAAEQPSDPVYENLKKQFVSERRNGLPLKTKEDSYDGRDIVFHRIGETDKVYADTAIDTNRDGKVDTFVPLESALEIQVRRLTAPREKGVSGTLYLQGTEYKK